MRKNADPRSDTCAVCSTRSMWVSRWGSFTSLVLANRQDRLPTIRFCSCRRRRRSWPSLSNLGWRSCKAQPARRCSMVCPRGYGAPCQRLLEACASGRVMGASRFLGGRLKLTRTRRRPNEARLTARFARPLRFCANASNGSASSGALWSHLPREGVLRRSGKATWVRRRSSWRPGRGIGT